MERLQQTITELNDKLKKKNKTPEELDEEFEQFYECVKDIATHPVVLRMKLTNKVSACFGGGMMHGDTCGAFTGAIMAVGLKYGHWDVNTLLRQKEEMMNKYAEF